MAATTGGNLAEVFTTAVLLPGETPPPRGRDSVKIDATSSMRGRFLTSSSVPSGACEGGRGREIVADAIGTRMRRPSQHSHRPGGVGVYQPHLYRSRAETRTHLEILVVMLIAFWALPESPMVMHGDGLTATGVTPCALEGPSSRRSRRVLETGGVLRWIRAARFFPDVPRCDTRPSWSGSPPGRATFPSAFRCGLMVQHG